MPEPSPKKPTSRAKAREIAAEIRRRIVAGEWDPGSRLPTKLELGAAFNAAGGTVQKALDRLAHEGFTRSRGCLGTFIRDTPPNKYAIGVVLARPASESVWYQAIGAAAAHSAHASRLGPQCYFGCNLSSEGPSRALQTLADDVQAGRLAGIISCCEPAALASVGITHDVIPMVRVGGTEAEAGTMPQHRLGPCYPLAMRQFQAHGRKRLGIITTFSYSGGGLRPTLECAALHGLETRRCFTHFFSSQSPSSARAVCELLMLLPENERPDALYINDDHLVTEATLGIADAGVKVPGDVEVIAHANYPLTKPTAVPANYLGYDSQMVLDHALDLMQILLAGGSPPAATMAEPQLRRARVRRR